MYVLMGQQIHLHNTFYFVVPIIIILKMIIGQYFKRLTYSCVSPALAEFKVLIKEIQIL